MPRVPAELPSGIRITDKVTFGVFAEKFPVGDVKAALAESNKATERIRDMPNHVVVYFAMMLALFRDANQEEVLRCVLEALHWLTGKPVDKVTGRSGISQARSRVGWEPLKLLYDRLAVPLAKKGDLGCYFKRWRIVALDGTTFNLGDTQENRDFFGAPGSADNENGGAYPQARVVSLVECGTHTQFVSEIGKYHEGEKTLALRLIHKLDGDMICLADRNFGGFELFCKAAESGAALVWRVRKDLNLDPIKTYGDGSFTANIFDHRDNRRKNPRLVRVIEYEVKGSKNKEFVRLITNIMDPRSASALELAELYSQRWEFEAALDEVKVHLNGNAPTLRSKVPELVLQELYGLFMAHYCIRSVMYDAASKARVDSDELSFTHSLRVIRRKLPMFGNFPPGGDLLGNLDRDSAATSIV